MIQNNSIVKKTLAAIVGVAAATGLLVLTPSFEGTKYTTYKDLGGVLTYCTGATENAVWGKTYTPAECKARLSIDLESAAQAVVSCVHKNMTDGQKIAFVDTAYNIGNSAFCKSSMTRLMNAGDVAGACNSLLMWNRVNGEVVRGLTNRRSVVREYCLGTRSVEKLIEGKQ